MKSSKSLVYLSIFILGIFFILILNAGRQTKVTTEHSPAQTTSITENNSPKILSTKPDPLEEAIVAANETIEFTFNKSLENVGEFKLRIEPKIEFKIALSQDRKTAKIIPLASYELGVTYTLFIGPDTKFEGVGAWRQEKIYHFKTIRYRGV